MCTSVATISKTLGILLGTSIFNYLVQSHPDVQGTKLPFYATALLDFIIAGFIVILSIFGIFEKNK
jgi:hypothetical protein